MTIATRKTHTRIQGDRYIHIMLHVRAAFFPFLLSFLPIPRHAPSTSSNVAVTGVGSGVGTVVATDGIVFKIES